MLSLSRCSSCPPPGHTRSHSSPPRSLWNTEGEGQDPRPSSALLSQGKCLLAAPLLCLSSVRCDGRTDVTPQTAAQETGGREFYSEDEVLGFQATNRLLGFLDLFFFYVMSVLIFQENNMITYLLYWTLCHNSCSQNNSSIVINQMILKRASCFRVLFLVIRSFCPCISALRSPSEIVALEVLEITLFCVVMSVTSPIHMLIYPAVF